ncbi:beta-lactamase/transpeptidase-like protein [Sistotremastrum niveocremeum HHB9708]|uniref:Beta-lactamase/transpeptidase-like protein n=1 Tax=Sistotremastrum niveocremeum HHB9708 TaxID=1314777 RepID=A0A164WQK9_9AGAM|nr:beta-lactamase/transpeptidase-like protein [Sistotremastrum niveocremeum HHB9708]
MALHDDIRASIDSVLETSGLPGLVYAAVNKHGEIVYEGAMGERSANEPDTKMTVDTNFWVASFTKLVTTIACLQLIEQGKVSLTDIVDPILPEVAELQILEGSKGNWTFRKPKTKITVKMLLNHTAGLRYKEFTKLIHEWTVETSHPTEWEGGIEGISLPLVAEPGETWGYGSAVDWIGVLVERVSGLKLNEYFRQQCPLGIKNTFFGGDAPSDPPPRAGGYARGPDGKLNTFELQGTVPLLESNTFHAGGAGLISNASDFLKILACLLNEGTVALMFQDSIPPSLIESLHNPTPETEPGLRDVVGPDIAKGWGLSFMITKDPLPTGRGAGSAWWTGIASCYYTIDPANGIATVCLSQILPIGDPAVVNAWKKAETELYRGLQVRSAGPDLSASHL